MNISKRAKYLVDNASPLVYYHSRALSTEGCLNFGLAENKLMDNELLEILNKEYHFSPEHLHYNNTHGMSEIHQAFTSLFKTNLMLDLDPKKIIIQAGSSAICENLSFCLFDEGDALLVPAPFYTGFYHDFEKRFKAKIIPFALNVNDHFSLDIKALEKAYNTHQSIKALLITNPNNPTGRCYTKEELALFVEFCEKNDLHLITDDVYAKSVHQNGSYTHVYELSQSWRHKTHFIYSMAKDFCLGGFKIGVFHTENEELFKAMKDASYFCTVSSPAQHIVAKLIQGEVDNLFTESSKRITQTHRFIKDNLKLPVPNIDAGIFFFMDFRSLLEDKSFDGELKLFDDFFNSTKINITPGKFFGMSEPGFFRVCFAKPFDEVKEFCHRVNDFISLRQK